MKIPRGIKIKSFEITDYLIDQIENNDKVKFHTFHNLDFVLYLENSKMDFEIAGKWVEQKEDEYIAKYRSDVFYHDFSPNIEIDYDSEKVFTLINEIFSPHG